MNGYDDNGISRSLVWLVDRCMQRELESQTSRMLFLSQQLAATRRENANLREEALHIRQEQESVRDALHDRELRTQRRHATTHTVLAAVQTAGRIIAQDYASRSRAHARPDPVRGLAAELVRTLKPEQLETLEPTQLDLVQRLSDALANDTADGDDGSKID